jgi:3-dehydroquinate dehydratase-1
MPGTRTTLSSAPTIGRLRLGGAPRVVLCVTDAHGGRLSRSARPDVVEVRIDLFRDRSPRHVEAVIRALRRARVPLIGTIRTAREGGRWTWSERERERLFALVLPLVDAVDLELSARGLARRIARRAHALGRTVIISSHAFRGTPPEATLARRIRSARPLGADIVKLASTARAPADVARLLRILVTHPRVPLVVIAMGPVGTLSRVFFPAAGSLLTYAATDSDAATAPGQLTLRALRTELARYYPDPRTWLRSHGR